MKLEASQRLKASDEYGWYILQDGEPIAGPFRSESAATYFAHGNHYPVGQDGCEIKYGCEEQGQFEVLSSKTNLN